MNIGNRLMLFCRSFLIINLILSLISVIGIFIIGKTVSAGYGMFLFVLFMVFSAVGSSKSGSGLMKSLPPEAELYIIIGFFIAYSIFLVFSLYIVLFAPTKTNVRRHNGTISSRVLSSLATLTGIVTAAAIWIQFFPNLIMGHNKHKQKAKQAKSRIEKIHTSLERNGGFQISAKTEAFSSENCSVVAYNVLNTRIVSIKTQHDQNKMCPTFSKIVMEALIKSKDPNENVIVEYRLPSKKVFLENIKISSDDTQITIFGRITINGKDVPLK